MGTNSIRLFDRRTGYFVAAIAMIFATFIPALVSAAQVTDRSIQLSSSAAQAEGVSYNVTFTPITSATAYVIDFCTNTPLVGQTCTAPTGFDATSASNYTTGVADDANTVVRTGTLTGGSSFNVVLSGIDNPDATGPLYARIVTFSADTDAGAYTSADPGEDAVDEGSVALYINNRIGVTGAVQETLTFCIAKNVITDNCDLTSNFPPNLKLGEEVIPGDVTSLALQPGVVSEDSLYTQISTNAVSGAIVNLKNNTACGGMKRASVSTCDIAPAQKTGIVNGSTTAKFGVKTNTATGGDGVLQPVTNSGYENTAFALNYAADNLSGVTSVYGDPFLDTNDTVVTNKNMQITFGAIVTNATPAGMYSADLSMIATGKF